MSKSTRVIHQPTNLMMDFLFINEIVRKTCPNADEVSGVIASRGGPKNPIRNPKFDVKVGDTTIYVVLRSWSKPWVSPKIGFNLSGAVPQDDRGSPRGISWDDKSNEHLAEQICKQISQYTA